MAAAPVSVQRLWPVAHEQGEGDRQVERRPLFAHVGRREVDGDAPRGELVARVHDRGAHALAALLHGGVGQPDDGEGRRRRHDVGLDGDGVAVEAGERFAVDAGEHAAVSGAGVEGGPQVTHARRLDEGVDRDDVEAHVGHADAAPAGGCPARARRAGRSDAACAG